MVMDIVSTNYNTLNLKYENNGVDVPTAKDDDYMQEQSYFLVLGKVENLNSGEPLFELCAQSVNARNKWQFGH